MFRKIPRTVFVLGLVSFFNDMASEMIYPIVPIFLTSVLHTSIPLVGLIEGTAEATASITKYIFGAYSDYVGKRKAFVTGGYSLGAVSKLLIGLAYFWPLVLVARFVDRLGKGLRTAPRDSLLLQSANKSNRGYIFGFHRSMDSLGAVVGPLIAFVLLFAFKENLRFTFFLAFIPGVVAVLLLVLLIKEKKELKGKEGISANSKSKRFFNFHWSQLNIKLKLFLIISLLFALGNSADSFLLLRGQNLGFSAALVVLAYIAYNLSQTIFATPLGHLSDKIGARKVFAGGLLVFAIVYFFFGFIQQSFWMWLLFPIYGVYIAATDGVSKAYISEFITENASGTFFGAYASLTAVGNFLASIVGGLLWSLFAPSATFYYGSIMALLAFVVLLIFHNRIEGVKS